MTADFAGARWWKFDFHTHTPASKDTPWFGIEEDEKRLKPEQWLLRFMKAGIDCVAVTDHNTGDWIDRLRDAHETLANASPSGFRPIHLFPGVEISVNGGFHLLAIFDPQAESRAIHDLLVRADYKGNPGGSNEVTGRSAVEVVALISAAGALPIPAHVDYDKGLLQISEGSSHLKIDANTVRQVLERNEILAAEVAQRNWIKHPIYTDMAVRWTEVLGSDCHNFRNGAQPGDRFTWVKMGAPSMEGLRLALLDGAPLSIRRSDTEAGNPNETPPVFLEGIEIADARYAGRGAPLSARFSPWLSALIGGRGTGKSTVVEMLRLCMRRDQELPDDLGADFQRFAPVSGSRAGLGALTDKTEIRVVVRKDRTRFRLRWRRDGSGPAIEEEDSGGQWNESPGVVNQRFPIRVLSQKQVFALAGDPGALLGLVDEAEAVKGRERATQRNEAEADFLSLRSQARALDARIADRERLAGDLADVERQIGIFEKGGNRDLLLRYQRFRRQRRILDDRAAEMESNVAAIREVADQVEPTDFPAEEFEHPDEVSGRQARDLAEEAVARQRALADGLREQAGRFDGFRREWISKVEDSAWSRRREGTDVAYRRLVEQLAEEGVSDPDAYGVLVQRRHILQDQLAELDGLVARRDDLERQADSVLEDIARKRREWTAARMDFLGSVLGANADVKVEVIPFGPDARAAETEFRKSIAREDGRLETAILTEDGERGELREMYSDLPEAPDERRAALASRIRDRKALYAEVHQGKTTLAGRKHLQNHLRKLTPEQMDRFGLWWPEDGLRVQYRRNSTGRFVSLTHGSPGQKSAAILTLLLAYGEEAIILDQPEDDLDNHLIYDLIVRQIREIKQRRQVIVATHNPNIVVNGDAEMVIAMDHHKGQCVVAKEGAGCLQDPGVRDEVCRVMEGGREAFKSRYRRLVEEPGSA